MAQVSVLNVTSLQTSGRSTPEVKKISVSHASRSNIQGQGYPAEQKKQRVFDVNQLHRNTYKGIRLPYYIDTQSLDEMIEEFEFKEDDVLLVSYPKSGNHWAKGFLPMLLNHETQLNLHHMPINMEGGYLDAQISMIPSGKRRIFHTHLPYQLLPKSAKNNPKLKIVLMTRSPLSTVTSFYHFLKDFHNVSDAPQIFDGDFDLFFRRWIEGTLYFGDWFQFHRDYWENLVKPAAKKTPPVSTNSRSSSFSSSSSSSSSSSFSSHCCRLSPTKRLMGLSKPTSKAHPRQITTLVQGINSTATSLNRVVSTPSLNGDISTSSLNGNISTTSHVSTPNRCYHLSFESLKDDFVGAMEGLGNFLQCPRSREFYKEIQAETSIEKMRAWCQVKLEEKVLAWPMDRLYRVGSQTDWKRLMNRKQAVLVRRLCWEKLREFELLFRDDRFLNSKPDDEDLEKD